MVKTMSPVLLFAVLLVSFFGVLNGNWDSLNGCGTLVLNCSCGKYPNALPWAIPLCQDKEQLSLGYLLYGKFLDADEHCEQFRNCKQCYPNGCLMCRSCPPHKFGKFCEENCECVNGEPCTRKGNCLCRDGFEGPKCESQRCGEAFPGRTPRIKHGSVTKIGQWPWQAALFTEYFGRFSFVCGGSLLNNLWVMTAAHCVTIPFDTTEVLSKEEIRVYLGKYYLEISKDDKYVQMPEVDEIYIHPNFTYETGHADIALIKLKKPVKMSTRVQPVCLPTLQSSEHNIAGGRKGVVTGWGWNENRTSSETLQQAEVAVVTGKYCKSGTSIYNITENMFCTGHAEPDSPKPFRGDSGGPIVFRDPFTERTRWVVEGIVSRGDTIETESGTTIDLMVYMTVSKFLDWIQSFLEKH